MSHAGGQEVLKLSPAGEFEVGTTASGITADDAGNIYAADGAAHNLRKYLKVK